MAEAAALDDALRAIAPARCGSCCSTTRRPTETLVGERESIWAFLGTDRLAAPIVEHEPDLVLHGHAHAGTFRGAIGEVPVFNVSVPVLGGTSGSSSCRARAAPLRDPLTAGCASVPHGATAGVAARASSGTSPAAALTRKELIGAAAGAAVLAGARRRQGVDAADRASTTGTACRPVRARPGTRNFAAFYLASHPRPVREAIARHRRGLDAGARQYLQAHEAASTRRRSRPPREHLGVPRGGDRA